jgi:hypothetical protein
MIELVYLWDSHADGLNHDTDCLIKSQSRKSALIKSIHSRTRCRIR